jgi:hypothetical protein
MASWDRAYKGVQAAVADGRAPRQAVLLNGAAGLRRDLCGLVVDWLNMISLLGMDRVAEDSMI